MTRKQAFVLSEDNFLNFFFCYRGIIEELFKVVTSIAGLMLCDFFWRALSNDFSATITTFWTKINNVISTFDHIKIVFDDKHGFTTRDKTVNDGEELFNICRMQAGGRFIENIEGFTRRSFGEFTSEFDSLRLAS